MQKRIAGLTLFLFVITAAGFAQMGEGNRPSPAESATCDLGAFRGSSDYSSPRMKGRKIFGELVPYGKVWRTGANDATTFVPSTDVMVGGKNIPAGKYTIFTIPNADKWTLIINKKTAEWRCPTSMKSVLARVDMKVSKVESPVENFTISYEKSGNGMHHEHGVGDHPRFGGYYGKIAKPV